MCVCVSTRIMCVSDFKCVCVCVIVCLQMHRYVCVTLVVCVCVCVIVSVCVREVVLWSMASAAAARRQETPDTLRCYPPKLITPEGCWQRHDRARAVPEPSQSRARWTLCSAS